MNDSPESIRILIAEDHPISRFALKHLLLEERLTVIGEAEDGEQAVGLTQELKPDIVLMDVNMAGMNGIQAS